ncbi:cardiolipin synthase ClsB [Arenimonas composti]|uniref:Cardiolipin synthase B n=1 Tax=Arenimonas composti TR7-09 = DSM 18010 TaxID=1121013 RepID=A0A091AZE6_9GAMM|nr:cardiolipin synthase ClsB [Arenimonas composti]KFN45703.1 hypothetical protein P873_02130 [Arenimonas composti TR7-09 = DSM 18010]
MNAEWLTGHRVSLLENGEGFYPRVQELVAAARERICVETFILADDEVGRELLTALRAAAARGVTVEVLVDGFGSDALPTALVDDCCSAGVTIHMFQPRRRIFGVRTNVFRRLHRKTLVIDGRIAVLGGINFCRDHLRASGAKSLQDYAAEVEGPVVGRVQAHFDREFGRAPRRPWWRRSPAAPLPAAAGRARAAYLYRDNGQHRADIEREYRRALRAARESVLLANAYFFPGYRLLRELRDAARRGVQVTVIVQGDNADVAMAPVAARWLYDYLIPAGVRIREYTARALHAKVAVIDGHWATVGSSNLDPLSLSLNLENNLFVDDPAFAAELATRLGKLLDGQCCEIARDALPARPWWWTPWRAIVFHVLRHFPNWAGWLPAHRARVEPVGGDA